MSIAKFRKSPLTEVIFGVEFNAPDFSSVDFGLYWKSIQERFPCQPIDRPPIGEIEILAILPTLRRVWFESTDKQQLIQLQSNRFYYNWRRQNESNEYPSFTTIYPKFEKEWTYFQKWWATNKETILPLTPRGYEFTYLNQINQNFGWNDTNDTKKIFTFLGRDWNKHLQNPNFFNTELEFNIPENLGILTVKVNQIIKVEDSSLALILDLTARSNDTRISLQKWFDLVHKYMVEAFLDLIQDNIKEEWGLVWLEQ